MIVGDAVQKIAAEGYAVQKEMRRLCQQQQAENRKLLKMMKLVSGAAFAASFISLAAVTMCFLW